MTFLESPGAAAKPHSFKIFFFLGGCDFLCIFLCGVDCHVSARLSSVCVKWRGPGCRQLFLSGCWDATTAPRGSWVMWQPWKITLGLLKQPIMIRRSSSTTGEWQFYYLCVCLRGVGGRGVLLDWVLKPFALYTHTEYIYISIYVYMLR